MVFNKYLGCIKYTHMCTKELKKHTESTMYALFFLVFKNISLSESEREY